ncbi:hypothetical protein PCAR4_230007 [Paraburkholderia caribensis]|nr:hypothetical protein PCAR4_230007 [Paraburkholderia caribensis]
MRPLCNRVVSIVCEQWDKSQACQKITVTCERRYPIDLKKQQCCVSVA